MSETVSGSAPAAAPIRLVLADDQALVRGGLAALLALERDIDVVAEVGRGDELLAAVERLRPDVCVVDIEMPGGDGITTTRRIRDEHPGVRVLIVTTFGRPGYVSRALESGAGGFVVKDTPAGELADAVRRVNAGETVVDPVLARDSMVAGPDPLTPREKDVLRHALSGARVADIAAELVLSQGTVRNHLSSAIAKTHTSTRGEAAREAQARGWL
ncbi:MULTISPECIES: response regulator transcription factor [Dietzia]|jgi:two-component system response regulator DesR|uniref:Response regulator transcription factor n=1 Tax=Dietzia maris TaxID=37915 RepID=A0ABT8H1V7_9ACTN|nr:MULTISPECIES: response regulator transcription factor [Dietzia]MCY1657863.1 response regulator transcription factor [Dietzia sp. SL131]MCZ4539452.1 response regulator transcription factor [Dietzia maris]MCZ4656083.1 response regulator transcription factor [Dietzia kunjamensis]MDJ0422672.1 response regulator transcription factor [Dietzia kunjamensis]MDN4506442.1 response regulator transcription factor [Dietzia maris]